MKFYRILIILFIVHSFSLQAQQKTIIYGNISDSSGVPLFLVNIFAEGTTFGTVTTDQGEYELELPSGKMYTIIVSSIGYQKKDTTLYASAGKRIRFDQRLKISTNELSEVSVSHRQDKSLNMQRVDMRSFDQLPNASGNLETILKTLPGVSSGNELSSQYSVRGGNFDENLVYVNDIEVYRPFLIRSGQQEGLSFVNPDLVSSVQFSAGGFESRFGDKMSSVLDITYRKPDKNAGSVSLSMLGGSAHYEGISGNKKFTWLAGVRYKTSRYLLTSLDTKGEYTPSFIDFQSFLTYHVSNKLDVSFLGNIAQNKYNFIPSDRETQFGTVNTALSFKVYYDGNEQDRFRTFLGAFTGSYHPTSHLTLKLIASGYTTDENEAFDIQGQYWINALDNNPQSETYGDSILNIGVGTYLNHARNMLNAYVASVAHKGTLELPAHNLTWGIKLQREMIDDRLREWYMVDSAGYSLPYSDSTVNLYNIIRATNSLNSNKLTSYIQDTWSLGADSGRLFVTGGIRGSYWDLNNEFIVSPRASVSYIPNWEKDMLFRFSTGYYVQYPFYKEMRDVSGHLNTDNIKAQRSWHFVLHGDYNFLAWERPFKFTTEVYYKALFDLIPYKVNDVRIQYLARNNARGYATGIDFKINGEFVPGEESWASLSFLRTREDQTDDFYIDRKGNRIEPGYYRRPTDQLINFGLFFQDYLPTNPSYKVHLNFLFGTNLPTSPPASDRYDLIYKIRPYRRVDIGFSKVFKSEYKNLPTNHLFPSFRSIWISAEVLNLFGVNNVISYQWVKTVSNLDNIQGQFAIPNFLTSRRFNLKITAKF